MNTLQIKQVIKLLQEEADNPPYEADQYSYALAMHRAVAELENLLYKIQTDTAQQ